MKKFAQALLVASVVQAQASDDDSAEDYSELSLAQLYPEMTEAELAEIFGQEADSDVLADLQLAQAAAYRQPDYYTAPMTTLKTVMDDRDPARPYQ